MSEGALGTVLLHNSSERLESTHERATREETARRVAKLKGFSSIGVYRPGARVVGPTYILPNETIVGLSAANEIGIRTEDDLLGGVVPHAFAATKAITHPLVSDDAFAPEGWSHAFAAAVEQIVLPGYTCFTIDDARTAGIRLLRLGSVRFKPVKATGGRGQRVVHSLQELETLIESVDTDTIKASGLVLERNLCKDIVTFSVGRILLAEFVASYFGVQNLVKNNAGQTAYGGSDLVVVRGDFNDLLRLPRIPSALIEPIQEARAYDAAASTCFPGLIASRRNYDIICGTTADGARCSGVLEQSWRIGGATPAEITALEEFRNNPRAEFVDACSFEIYGKNAQLPEGAVVYFEGLDERVGPITKYACLKRNES